MQSNRFQNIAKEIAKRDKPVFDALIEFEQTGRIISKTRLNFTMDKAIASRFRKFCRKKGYSMSAKIEQVMQETLKEETN